MISLTYMLQPSFFFYKKKQKITPKITFFIFMKNRSYLVSLFATRWEKLKNVNFVNIGCFVQILWNPENIQDGRQKVIFLQYLSILWVKHTSVTHLRSYFFKENLFMHTKHRFKKIWGKKRSFHCCGSLLDCRPTPITNQYALFPTI